MKIGSYWDVLIKEYLFNIIYIIIIIFHRNIIINKIYYVK